ncbi:hypothetical protein SAMN05428959_10361 [Duganella sp. CF517]|uniref:DUF5908 family protein n=1 Tax=Duganella sp. CF517 TaxID=1881038 RepID=UPI0008D5ED3F|nr:DUF5908 family protein [Duganella sp. CF517]SEN77454.1 hypothetical protein SAMN05428959_10361 [Duganella sp. CF517]
MPIDIQNLHIKSTVVQRAGGDEAAGAAGEPAQPVDERAAARLREQLLAECKRMIRDALNQRQER